MKSKTGIKLRMRRRLCQLAGAGFAVVLAGALLAPAAAGAAELLLSFDRVYSGTNPPAAAPPWVEATFQDVSGGVLVSLEAVGLSAGEFVSKVYFNLNPAYDPSGPGALSFNLQGQSGLFDLPAVEHKRDTFRADGDGKFDVRLSFSELDGSGHRFEQTCFVAYLISGIPGLQASDFAYRSAGSTGGLYGAAHIQGIDSGADSIWASANIPEPSHSLLLGLATGLWAGARLRWHRRKAA